MKPDGSIVCWGYNDFGAAAPPAGEFASVSVGWSQTCGVRTDGSIVCWGEYFSGRAIPARGEFASVSAGEDHTCGIKTDGSVVCWGEGYPGVVAPPPVGEFTSISAGNNRTCGIKTDGSATCWGEGYYQGEFTLTPPEGEFASVSGTCGVKRTALSLVGVVAALAGIHLLRANSFRSAQGSTTPAESGRMAPSPAGAPTISSTRPIRPGPTPGTVHLGCFRRRSHVRRQGRRLRLLLGQV